MCVSRYKTRDSFIAYWTTKVALTKLLRLEELKYVNVVSQNHEPGYTLTHRAQHSVLRAGLA